jgi:hypothetical protein
MSTPAFDPLAIMAEVFASANASPPATTATLRHNGPNCRKVATVATPLAANLARNCRKVAIVATGDAPDEESAALIEERAGLCADSIPPLYLDTWARLNCQKPLQVSEADWRRALDDGGRFLDTWGWVTECAWAWMSGELFDIPSLGKPGGLIWRLRGRAVVSYGPNYVRLDDDTIIERC